MMEQPRVGLALGSGSARGWAHIGVMKALIEAGIRPAVVSGCSIGALVGAAMAAGRLDDLDEWVRRLDWRGIVGFLDVNLAGGGLIEGERLIRALGEGHDQPLIEDLPIPFGAVATDLESGREVWLRKGSLLQAVRASIALPGLFSPLRHDGRWLVDGGLVNPVPVSLCRALGADVVIAVNLNGDIVGKRRAGGRAAAKGKKPKPPASKPKAPGLWDRVLGELPGSFRDGADRVLAQILRGDDGGRPSYYEVVADSINIMQDLITRSRMAGDPPEVLLSPKLSHIRLMEFNRGPEAIDEGRAVVERMLPTIREAIG